MSGRSGGGDWGSHRSNDWDQQEGDDGRWQNDMYESVAQEPRGRAGGSWGDGGYREGRDAHGDSRGNGPRGRARPYGGDRHWGEDGGGRRSSDGHRGHRGYRGQNHDRYGGPSSQEWAAGSGVGNGVAGALGEGHHAEGSERWQKHAQNMSARSGGGGSGSGSGFYQQRQAQSQRPEMSDEREQGRVCSMKESFGFVRCVDRRGDLFFHLTEAPSDVKIGDEVDFYVGTGGRSGKDCALQLNVLPPGTVTSEVVLNAIFLGVIERDIRAYPSSMPSTHRAHMMGRSRPHDFQQTEGLIKRMLIRPINDAQKITGAAPQEDVDEKDPREVVEEDSQSATEAAEAGDSEGTSPPEDAGGGDVEDASGWQQQPEEPETSSDAKGPVSGDLGLTGAMVSYVAGDLLDEKGNTGSANRFRRGDEIRFKVSQEKVTGRKRAVEVVLVRTKKEREEEEQLQKLMDSGASRHLGVVKKVNQDYGFLQSLSCPDTIYFTTGDVDLSSANGGRLHVGSQAEFWVVPDRTRDKRDSFRALDVILLPPGSFAVEDQTHAGVRGTVERAPTVPQRPSYGGSGRDGGGGGGGNMQPGSARFEVKTTPPTGSSEDPDAGDEGRREASTPSSFVTASLIHKELSKSQVPTLEVGDVIQADLWRSKLGGGKTQARNMRLVSFGGERREGVVRSVRDGGFGFIRPLGGTHDVYFRLSDTTCKNLHDVREGSEVSFTMKDSDRFGSKDGDRGSDRKDKQRATRVEVLPKGTLTMEVTLATDVNGVVTREAKGGGQGSITVTDGNSLEVPLGVRHPKIATQIANFAAQAERHELSFSSGLTAGERNAAHRLAAEAGLGHESTGEEGSRTLRVWKPDSREEAEAIREAEAKRAEEFAQAAKERSKNGERSLSVSYYREESAAVTSGATGKAATALARQDRESGKGKGKGEGKGEGEGQSVTAGPPGEANEQRAPVGDEQLRAVEQEKSDGDGHQDGDKDRGKAKSKLTQDFRTERGHAPLAPRSQRGDLVTFDVVLDVTNMKRRAIKVTVTKSAATVSQSNTTNEDPAARGFAGGTGDAVIIQENTPEQVGVVSLVHADRHYGFIELPDIDDRVFFHLSEVLPEAVSASASGGQAHAGPGDANANASHRSGHGGGSSSTGGKTGAAIKRGQEVSFRLALRQGKPVGVRVRKLPPGTLSKDEWLPSRFVGVIVVSPRASGTVEAEKSARDSACGLEGALVMLKEKTACKSEPGGGGAPDGSGVFEDPAAEGAGEDSASRHAEKEATKAHRMLSSAGIRVAPSAVDPPLSKAARPVPEASFTAGPPGPSAHMGIFRLDEGHSRSAGVGGPPAGGLTRYSILPFLATDTLEAASDLDKGATTKPGVPDQRETTPEASEGGAGEGQSTIPEGTRADSEAASVAAKEGAAAGTEPPALGATFVSGDVVEFSIIARRGQRQQTQRVGRVSLVTKAGYICRRGKVTEIDRKTGTVSVKLVPTLAAAEGAPPSSGEINAGTDTGEVPSEEARLKSGGQGGVGDKPQSSASTSSRSAAQPEATRAFFSLQGVAGPAGVPGRLWDGEEVDVILPNATQAKASPEAVGGNDHKGVHADVAVRVQDLKSLSGTRQRLNINLRDSQRGPQVRMALGPDAVGFKPGHRTMASLYDTEEAKAPMECDSNSSAGQSIADLSEPASDKAMTEGQNVGGGNEDKVVKAVASQAASTQEGQG